MLSEGTESLVLSNDNTVQRLVLPVPASEQDDWHVRGSVKLERYSIFTRMLLGF